MVYPVNYCNYIFLPLFCHFLPNFKFSGYQFVMQWKFLGACFDLFDRIFDHLATAAVSCCGFMCTLKLGAQSRVGF
jgi:hypothetical protein